VVVAADGANASKQEPGFWRSAIKVAARCAFLNGAFGGMLTGALSIFITFAPADNWLSRLIGDQLAGQAMFTAGGAILGAVLGVMGAICCVACSAAWRWLRDR
jgi:hypothetical protein